MRAATLPIVLTLALSLGSCAQVESAQDRLGAQVDDIRETAIGVKQNVDEFVQTLKWCTSAFRLAAAVAQRDVEAATAAAEGLRATAPEALIDDFEVLLAAVAEAEAGNTGALADEEVVRAGEELLAYTTDRCDVTGDDGAPG